MNSANLPTQADLNSLYGSWNPGAYMRGFENQGLADQFREQSYAGNAQTLESDQQKINKAYQMDPLDIAGKQLSNEGLGYKNTIDKLGAERATANQPFVLDEDLRQHALKMSEDDFKKADQQIEKLLRSPNPADVQMGLKLQAATPAMLAEKRKNDQAMALEQERSRAHLAGIGAQTASQKDLEQMRIDAGKYNRSNMALTLSQRLMKARTAAEKAEILEEGFYVAQAAGDEEASKEYAARALQARQRAAEDAANRAAGSPGIAPQVGGGGALSIVNKPPAAAEAPIAGKPGTAANPIKLD